MVTSSSGQHTYVNFRAHHVIRLLFFNQKTSDSKYAYTFEFIVDILRSEHKKNLFTENKQAYMVTVCDVHCTLQFMF